MDNNSKKFVAIMAGGIGSRFWPSSRISKPKQFLDIQNNGKSLLQQTFERFEKFIPSNQIFIVTSKDYINLVAEQLPSILKSNIIGEPARKNTATCIAYIAFKINEINKAAQLICAPADHLISNTKNFEDTCIESFNFLDKNENAFITIGIKPTFANTGFGYIQFIPEENAILKKVKTFTEKPNKEMATQFLNSGEFLWNAGIYIAQNKTILNSIEQHMPDVYDIFNKHATCFNTQLENGAIEKIYPLCPNISFDYAVMEKVKDIFVYPASFSWNDLGTWNSLYEVTEKDKNDNVIFAQDCIITESKNNILQTDKNKLLIVKGLENYIVVDTKDALMIYPKSDEQEIKNITESIKTKKLDKYL